MKNVQLVVPDATAAHRELLDRGVEVGEVTVVTDADADTFFGSQDPDGNSWAVLDQGAISQAAQAEDHVGPCEWAGG